MMEDANDDDDWDREFADPIGVGKLLSAIDTHLAWCRITDAETMEMSDDEFRARMERLDQAGETIRSMLQTLIAIGDCLHCNVDAACLHTETEANIFAGLAKAVDKHRMTDREITRAHRRARSLWCLLYPEAQRDYTRGARFYAVLRELVVKELRRELDNTYAGAVAWAEGKS